MKKLVLLFVLSLIAAFTITGISLAVRTTTITEPVLKAPSTFINTPIRTIRRDDDNLLTYRFMVSKDNGATWSGILNTGDTGMWEIGPKGDTLSAFNAASYNFNAIADKDNNLHFLVVLSAFGDINNPGNRVNGLYDIKTDADAATINYYLVAAMPEGVDWDWSDVGVDAQGNIYTIWTETTDTTCAILASKSTDGGVTWKPSEVIKNNMTAEGHYPHMTPRVGDYFYILWQEPNAETGKFDQNVIKVGSALTGGYTEKPVVGSAGSEYSYYITAVNPIDQDVTTGDVYLVFRNETLGGTAVIRYKEGVADWTTETVAGLQRYPSVLTAKATPWVFSNFGVTEPPHSNWFAYDGNGYGGGDWVGPTAVSSIPGNELLYVHMGDVTTSGRLFSGCNVWNNVPSVTPSGFMVRYSDDDGTTWSDTLRILNAWRDMLDAKYLPQVSMFTSNDYVWIAFAGRYGETDLQPPKIDDENITLSSYTIGQPWVVSVSVVDSANGIGALGLEYLNINSKNPNADWAMMEPDSADTASLDAIDNGKYYFTIPSEVMYDSLIAPGDSIYFRVYVADGVSNEAKGTLHLIIANNAYIGVDEEKAPLPTEVSLGQNYPNPFNSSTVIPFSLSRTSNVTLTVFDISGRLVETLYNGNATAGRHFVSWNGANVSSGIYFYALQVGDQRFIGKLSYVR